MNAVVPNAVVPIARCPSKVLHHPGHQARGTTSTTTKHVLQPDAVPHVQRPSKALPHSVHQARGIASASSISLSHRSSTAFTSQKHSFTSGSARPSQHKPSPSQKSLPSKVLDRFPRAQKDEGRNATGQPASSKNQSVSGARPHGQPQAKATTSLGSSSVSPSQDKGSSRNDKQPATREAISGWHSIYGTTPRKRSATTRESDSETDISVCDSQDSAPPSKRPKYAGLKFRKTVPLSPHTSAASSPSPRSLSPLALPPVPLPATSPEKTSTREDSGLFAPVEDTLSGRNSPTPQNALEQLVKDPSTSQLLGQLVADVVKAAMQNISSNIQELKQEKIDKPKPKHNYHNSRWKQPQPSSQPPWRKHYSPQYSNRWGGGDFYPQPSPQSQPFSHPGQVEQQWGHFPHQAPDAAGPSRVPQDAYEQNTDVFVIEHGQMSFEYPSSTSSSKPTNTVVNTVQSASDISMPDETPVQRTKSDDVATEWSRNVEDILADAEKDYYS
ncbi:hypothetical protein BDZ89DRAFT_1056371 [Hymenopellis radicata]|nr:hypothetical protein BDZ89DRAFT_1056371 [Hymenopellis radicata]